MVPNVAGSNPVDRPFSHWYSVTFLQALVLGIVQGITEFFPVSSSAHLRLVKFFFQIHDGEHLLYFDLLCHAGTLLALVIFLRREIIEGLSRPIPCVASFLNFKGRHNGPSLNDRSSAILRQYGPPHDPSNLDHSEATKITKSKRSPYKKIIKIF